MKIDKAEIAGKLAKQTGLVSSKVTTDFLKGVLFKDGTMTATNTELTIVSGIEAEIETPFILPQRGIDVIENLPDGEIEISVHEKSLTVKAPGIINRVPLYAADKYPEPPAIKGGESIGIDAEELGEAINAVLYAVSTDNTKPVHTGLLFRGDEKTLNLVGCDGYRVAWNTLDYTEKVDMVVPRESLQKMLQLGLKGNVEISYDLRHAVFKADEYTVFTRLLEGEFLDFKKVFPAGTDLVSLDRKMLISAVQRANIFVEQHRRPVEFRFENETLNIKVNSADGEYSEDMTLESPYIGSLRIGFNSRFLLDALKSFQCGEVECSLKGELGPMSISDGVMKALVLPVRLKSQ